MCGASVCDLETSIMRGEGAGPELGYCATGKEVECLRMWKISVCRKLHCTYPVREFAETRAVVVVIVP